MIDDHTGIFHMQDFHDSLSAVNKNEDTSLLYILAILLVTIPLRV